MENFVKRGEVQYSSRYFAEKFWRNIRLLFLYLNRNEAGEYYHDHWDEGIKHIRYKNEKVEELLYDVVAEKEGWVPLEEIKDADLRELLRISRLKAFELFGGRLPVKDFVTVSGWSSGDMWHNPLIEFLKTGRILYFSASPATKFWLYLKKVILDVENVGEGKYDHLPFNTDEDNVRTLLLRNITKSTINLNMPDYGQLREYANLLRREKLIKDVMAKAAGWVPLHEIKDPETRKLLKIVRDNLLKMTNGEMPTSIETQQGWKIKLFPNTQAVRFVKEGVYEYSAKVPAAKLWGDLILSFISIERLEDGTYSYKEMSREAKEAIYQVVAKKEGWIPLEEIHDPEVRELLKLVREKMIELYGGKFPGNKGISSRGGIKIRGELHRHPILIFIKYGVLRFSHSKSPKAYMQDLRDMFFNLKSSPDGELDLVDADPKVVDLTGRIQEKGEVAYAQKSGRYDAVSYPAEDIPSVAIAGRETKKEGAKARIEIAGKRVDKTLPKKNSRDDLVRLKKEFRSRFFPIAAQLISNATPENVQTLMQLLREKTDIRHDISEFDLINALSRRDPTLYTQLEGWIGRDYLERYRIDLFVAVRYIERREMSKNRGQDRAEKFRKR